MSEFNSSSAPDVIRITEEDTSSTHVEDLLRRHASMRGEQGIARDRGRKWYYQNWFVFMLAGLAAALTASAIINHYFTDLFYVQGTVQRIGVLDRPTLHYVEEGKPLELPPEDYIPIQVGSHLVAFVSNTRWHQPNGKYIDFDPLMLKEGQVLGIYVNYLPESSTEDKEYSIARFVLPDPKPTPADPSLRDLERNKAVMGISIFPLTAALVGLFIAAADGFICRLPRRVLLAGFVGLLFGAVGGYISGVLAEIIYAPLTQFARAEHNNSLGFSFQTAGRGLAWAMGGMSMGLGQGIALRSKRLLLYGFLGGLIGGLVGGLFFDPIYLIFGADTPSAALSRWIGFSVIGLTVGLMIGIVERLARDAWLRMVQGPLAGKEFLVFKDVMRMGASPASEIYLFNDPAVAPKHAVIRMTGDIYEIENASREAPVCVNGRPIQRARLRHGDRISLGRTSFVFQRQGPQ